MDREMSSLRASMDVSDRPEPGSHSHPLEPHPNELENSDVEKLLPHGPFLKKDQQKPLLEKSFLRSLLSFSWLIHFIALGCTAAAVQLTFNNTYWADEADWNNRFLWSILRGTRIQDILQFAAKLYEIIVVMSLSAMVMHALRRMLVGDGVAFGLLSGAYQVGAPTYFFSRELWAPFLKPKNPRNFLMALSLASLVVYANMVGPFTAIIISPTLEWWPIHDPYNGEPLTSYITADEETIYPTLLDEEQLETETCKLYAEPHCPDSGFPEIKDILEAWTLNNARPLVQLKHSGAETARQLASTLQYSTEDEHLAIATTLHSSVVELAGSFWHYISSNQTHLRVNASKRPRFIPTTPNVYAPLVQVQCNRYSYNKLRKSGGEPVFPMGRMRNFSSYSLPGHEDSYKAKKAWDVPKKLWDVEIDDISEIKFKWVDVSPHFEDEAPSLAALAWVPMTRNISVSKSMKDLVQDSLLMPCTIDARWAKVKTNYDPTADNLLPNHLTDFSMLAPFWREKKYTGDDLKHENIRILPTWAKSLDRPTKKVVSAAGTTFEGTAMNWLLDSFTFPAMNGSWDFTAFKTENFTFDLNDERLENEATRAVATTISLALADGLSRVSLTEDLGMIVHDHGNGTVQWKELWLQAGGGSVGTSLIPKANLTDMYPIVWAAERKGWGYGFKSPTITLGVILLLAHSALVVAFSIYVLWFRLRQHGWASGAWGGISTLTALALVSRKPSNEELVRDLAEGNNKWKTMNTAVFVRSRDRDKVELLIGEGSDNGRLVIGRSYSN